MRFFKYLIFVFFLFSVTPAFADYYTLPGYSQEFSTLDSACKHWRDNNGYKGWEYTTDSDTCFFYHASDPGYVKQLKPTKVESCPGLARTKPIYINGWTNWSPDQMDDYLKKVSPTICSKGCRFKDPALIGSSIAGDNQDMMQVSYANGVKDSSCPSTDDPGYPPNPDGSPGGPPPFSCQGDYCKKPPEGCPENYKEGMFNDEQYCFKPVGPNEPSASEPTDPNEPSASEPNGGGDGKGNCNGTNNCNTNTLEVDVKKIVDAIAQSAQSIVSSINGAVKSISDVIKTTSENIVNSVKNVETEVKETNKKLDQTNEKLDHSNKKLDALESSASTANAHLDALEKSASEANGHLDAMEKSASEIRDFLKDDKLPEGDNNGSLDIGTHTLEPVPDTFRFNAQCPAPVVQDVSIIGYTWKFSFSFDLYCNALGRLSTYFVFAAYLAACFIIAGVKN